MKEWRTYMLAPKCKNMLWEKVEKTIGQQTAPSGDNMAINWKLAIFEHVNLMFQYLQMG